MVAPRSIYARDCRDREQSCCCHCNKALQLSLMPNATKALPFNSMSETGRFKPNSATYRTCCAISRRESVPNKPSSIYISFIEMSISDFKSFISRLIHHIYILSTHHCSFSRSQPRITTSPIHPLSLSLLTKLDLP